jgi:hypothetical protein
LTLLLFSHAARSTICKVNIASGAARWHHTESYLRVTA